MLGGHIIQAQQYHGAPNSQSAKAGQYGNVTVIKENNIVMQGNISHGIMAQGGANSSQPTNMMVRRLADQGQNN